MPVSRRTVRAVKPSSSSLNLRVRPQQSVALNGSNEIPVCVSLSDLLKRLTYRGGEAKFAVRCCISIYFISHGRTSILVDERGRK